MSIQIICAWCGKKMGTKPGGSSDPISHSICRECSRKARDESSDRFGSTTRHPQDAGSSHREGGCLAGTLTSIATSIRKRYPERITTNLVLSDAVEEDGLDWN